eukprot:scaffold372048_cov45-Prasinocladus_malaysianus.AAC.1
MKGARGHHGAVVRLMCVAECICICVIWLDAENNAIVTECKSSAGIILHRYTKHPNVSQLISEHSGYR